MSKLYDKYFPFFLDSLSGWEAKCFVQGSMTIVCFYLGEIFRAICFSLKERSDGKKQKGWWRKKTFLRLNEEEVLYGFRESQSVLLVDEVSFFAMKIESNFSTWTNMSSYERRRFSLKILYRRELRSFIVLTRFNSISRILHDQFIRARMCMFESKGYHANWGAGINSSNFYARSWRRNG